VCALCARESASAEGLTGDLTGTSKPAGRIPLPPVGLGVPTAIGDTMLLLVGADRDIIEQLDPVSATCGRFEAVASRTDERGGCDVGWSNAVDR
jgi:hypothetical protein